MAQPRDLDLDLASSGFGFREQMSSGRSIVTTVVLVCRCVGALSAPVTNMAQQPPPQRLWQLLENEQPAAWKTIFGDVGERGEYMDGYSEQAMFDRCKEDYRWEEKFSPPDVFQSERAKMVGWHGGRQRRLPPQAAQSTLSFRALAFRRCPTCTTTTSCGGT